MNNRLINIIETPQMKNIPYFKVGYIIEIEIWVHEGKKTRIQKFEGYVISKKNRGLNSSFTVRKISYGEGMERVFQNHSPIINKILIKRKSSAKKSKLYYFRNLTLKYIKSLKYMKIYK